MVAGKQYRAPSCTKYARMAVSLDARAQSLIFDELDGYFISSIIYL